MADDRAERFARELEAVGGHVYRVSDREGARQMCLDIVAEKSARKVVRSEIDIDLDEALRSRGVEVSVADTASTPRERIREIEFEADVGITSADYGIAETGTLALAARPRQGRAVSLLPPVHVAVLEASRIVSDLAELFERLRGEGPAWRPASAYTLITGPSRTGDIELVLTVGVHGPGELHVVLVG